MKTLEKTLINWHQLTHDLGHDFASRADRVDKEGGFVYENYKALQEHRYFSAAVPSEFGGGGCSHQEVCDLIRIIAQYCGSTALAFSMHQHLIAAAVWRYKHKGESAPLPQRVANEQLVLVSTGGRDWLDSNGEMTRTQGGYLFTAKKLFASQCPVGDLVVTSAPYLHPEDGWQVLHFAVPLNRDGVDVLNDWDVMGMRATGSQTIEFTQVFVPDSAITLTRPRNGYHPVWDVVLTVAMPIIMSVYVGIAEKAFDIAMFKGRTYERGRKHLPYIIGKMHNTLTGARSQWKAMTTLADDINFKPSETITIDMLSLKTNVANACVQTVQQAMDAIGGQSFYRKNTLERLFRDVQGAHFHPLPEWEQYAFTGERLLSKSAAVI